LLAGVGACLGGSLLGAPAAAAVAAPRLSLSFRGELPPGVIFRRASAAMYLDEHGRIRKAAPDEPRFRGGLLIEGASANLIPDSTHLVGASGWRATNATAVAWQPGETAPDGSLGVWRIDRAPLKPGSRMAVRIAAPVGEGFGCGSVWLRSPSGSGKWRLGLFDIATGNGVSPIVEVEREWRRCRAWRLWQYRDTGDKLFALVDNAPAPRRDPEPIPALLDRVLVWAPQYETAAEASSPIPTAGAAERRAADEVSLAAEPLAKPQGRLLLELPEGGRAGGVILDASCGDRQGIRIGYSDSGWIMARVGGLEIAGIGDATGDTVIELKWSGSGVQISSGPTVARLLARAGVRGNLGSVECEGRLRLGMTGAGQQPLNRPLAALTFEDWAGEIELPPRPVFVPSGYRLVFGDDFDDPDLARINENANGGRPGAPAWRSRYAQDRHTVINGEKQIYMDREFAGTGRESLGVQPFSIRDGVLRIRADRADPIRVSPYIWNYRYISGCITSELTHVQKYGYFEICARLPLGKGFWPAFWLFAKRPSRERHIEIDVFEGSGTRRMSVHHAAIERTRPPGGAWQSFGRGAWIDGVIDVHDAFHIYGMEWTEAKIAFFLDGRKTLEADNTLINDDMYLLANLALGSKDPNGWIPDSDDTTPFPAFLEIDYIRAYAR